MKKYNKKFVSPISLQEVYAETGEYSAKMIIDPKLSPTIDDVAVDIRNSDGESMDFTAKRWGTKLTVSFKIDHTTPDGVSIIDILLKRKDQSPIKERLDFWVIK